MNRVRQLLPRRGARRLATAGLLLGLALGWASQARPEGDLAPETYARMRDAMALARKALRKRDHVEALTHLTQAHELAEGSADTEDAVRSRILILKGDVHEKLWQYGRALECWTLAAEFTQGRQQTVLLQRIAGVERLMRAEALPDLRDTYRAGPGIGPAATLEGRIAVIYMFIGDAGGGTWGPKQRAAAIAAWEEVEKWISATIEPYGATVQFEQRQFLIDRHPTIERMSVGGLEQRYENLDQVLQLAVEHLGAPDPLTFIERIQEDEQADGALLLLHFNRDDRSFAHRCLTSCTPTGEYAVIMTEARSRHWQALEYSLAHESLHVFGADDLYRLTGAADFADTDIMNYVSSRLGGSTVDPITAYAVGLLNERPETPFKVKTYSRP